MVEEDVIVTSYPDTPVIGPDTPGVEFLIPLIWSSGSHKYNKHTLSLSLTAHSPSRSLSLFHSLMNSPSPSQVLSLSLEP